MSQISVPFDPIARRHKPPVLHPISKEVSAFALTNTPSLFHDVGPDGLNYLPFQSTYISAIL